MVYDIVFVSILVMYTSIISSINTCSILLYKQAKNYVSEGCEIRLLKRMNSTFNQRLARTNLKSCKLVIKTRQGLYSSEISVSNRDIGRSHYSSPFERIYKQWHQFSHKNSHSTNKSNNRLLL